MLRDTCRSLPIQERQKINKEISSGHIEGLNEDEIAYKQKLKAHGIYKKYILINREYLERHGSKKDKFVLKYFQYNPRILIILDDCVSSHVKELNASVEKIFFEGRHRNITLILAT